MPTTMKSSAVSTV